MRKMGQSSYLTTVLNGTMAAMKAVIPLEIHRGTPCLVEHSVVPNKMCVLVGIVGELSGRLIFEGSTSTFATMGQHMFGAVLEGEMLESFVGELGNMIAGNTARELSNAGVIVNISPPTVLIGSTKITGFDRGVLVPVAIGSESELRVLIVIENEEATVTI
jgi:chemotaxis protein CheX